MKRGERGRDGYGYGAPRVESISFEVREVCY
jgi:hypothetical protein